MKEIDACGAACPAPVLMAKSAVENEGADRLSVTVDNDASRQNVSRFLESKGFAVTTESKNGIFQVNAVREPAKTPFEDAEAAPQPATDPAETKLMVLITSDKLGRGDDELGAKLMASYLKTLEEIGDSLWRLVFLNGGVKLTIEDAETLPVLQGYEKNGLTILVCGTCLNHFELLEQKRVGETTNMLDIVTAMHLAGKVITV